MPVLVATSRMYRGEHHPTDVLGSLIFAALWLTVATMLIKPNAEARGEARQGGSGKNGRQADSKAAASPAASPAARARRALSLPGRSR